MTKEEFMEMGTDVFTDYLPKIKASERKAFLEALLDEMTSREVVSIDDEEAKGEDLTDLFDSYSND